VPRLTRNISSHDGGKGQARVKGGEFITYARALREGWDIPQDTRKLLIQRCKEVLNDPELEPRSVSRIGQTLAMLERLVLDSQVAADKIERLDKGQATENVGVTLTPEQVAAVAKTLGGLE